MPSTGNADRWPPPRSAPAGGRRSRHLRVSLFRYGSSSRIMRDMPTSATQTPPPVNGLIVDQDLPTEMRTSFLEYAYSVIYARALPDARDGLKPVQRRILFQMDRMGLRPDRPHVKCSRVVGDVMGRLHPHGDVAISEALVRLSQPFAMLLPLLDGLAASCTRSSASARLRVMRRAAP